MRTSLVRRGAMTAVVVIALTLAGCATSPPTRFYVLTPIEVHGAETSSVSDALTIGVRSVDVPDELDRLQIMTRTGPNSVHFAEFEQWSAPLRESVVQIIAGNLASLLPGDQVAVYPWIPGTAVDRQVIVEITRFDGELGGQCALRARWRVLGRRGGPPAVYGESAFSDAAGPDYAALVATQSRLLGALSAEIAATIRNGRADATPPSPASHSLAGNRSKVDE